MNGTEKAPLAKPEGHLCFACGTANPIGLNMTFYRDGEHVCSEVALGRYHVGWEKVAHGGIIFTLLDEVMSWTVMYWKKAFFVTRKMDVKYVRNVPIEVPLTVCGRILDDSQPPKVRARAEIRDGRGALFVRAHGEFVLLERDQLHIMPEQQQRQMLELFERFEQDCDAGTTPQDSL
ncbi:MAG: PaaI family thioesterase [Deltaproteobacteria bacterium]|nr:PaaI family thioesterase [Deltaproteobacteria bacterium]